MIEGFSMNGLFEAVFFAFFEGRRDPMTRVDRRAHVTSGDRPAFCASCEHQIKK